MKNTNEKLIIQNGIYLFIKTASDKNFNIRKNINAIY